MMRLKKETWHENYIRKHLPMDLQKMCTVSLSIQDFLDIVHGHLKTIYGERADWKKNIEKYYQSEEFISQCHSVKDINSIPKLSFADIKNWIIEEERFKKTVSKLIDLLPAIQNGSENATREASIMLGLVKPNPDTIYHWIVDWEDASEEEIEVIMHNIQEHPKEFNNVVAILIKLCLNGRLVTYPVIETVMTQQKTRYYYRGENAFYGSSKPGAFRWAKKSIPEYIVHRVNDLRRNEGRLFLDNFNASFAWPNSSTNHYALCQHYGLNTEMLDITSDILSALFFATAKYEDGKWRPLNSSEIEKANSRQNIFKHGGDSRYAILYKRLAELVELEWIYKDESNFWNTIFPIGYQPFMRCAYQHAYGLFENSTNYDMYLDENFEKYKIRLTEDLCNWVFEQTHQGKDVFPIDDIPDISRYLNKINETRRFSWDNFKDIMEGHKIPKNQWKQIKCELFRYGYSIDKSQVTFITDDEIKQINKSYPPERAKLLTTAEPVSDPLLIMIAD